jgi:predicted DNA-binding transcriptional regulator AlpA
MTLRDTRCTDLHTSVHIVPKPKSALLPEALQHFDALPDSANVRQPVVQALFAISAPTVWRWVKAGRLPKPRKHGQRVTTWNVGELRKCLAGAA